MHDTLGNDVETVTEYRRSSRVKRAPSWHQDYEISINTAKVCSTAHPISNVLSYLHFSKEYEGFVATSSHVVEPVSYHEDVKDKNWVKAIKNKITLLENNNTWLLVPLPKNKNIISCKWVYKVNYKSNGSIERYKARLVVKGYSQQERIDFSETLALVAKMVRQNYFSSCRCSKWLLF